jgi:hypothetical protein
MINASQESIKKQGASFKNQNLSLSQGLKEKEKEVREAKTTANENYKKIIFQPEVFQRTKIHFENAEKERFEKAKIEAEKQKILEEKKQSKGKGFRK